MEATKQQTAKNKKKGVIITISVIVGMVLLGFGGIYYLQCRNDNAVWTSVQNDGTISGYQRFIQQYPSNSHVEEAKKILHQLQQQDETAWSRVLTMPNSNNLNTYINLMSKTGGLHLENAAVMLDFLEWTKVSKSMDPELIRAYMAKFPGKHQDEISSLLNRTIKIKAKNKILNFLTLYSDENIEAVMNYFSDNTPVYRNKTDVSRYELYDDLKGEFIEEGKVMYAPDFSQLEAHEDSKGNLITVFPATKSLPEESVFVNVLDSLTPSAPVIRFHISFSPEGKINLLQTEE